MKIINILKCFFLGHKKYNLKSLYKNNDKLAYVKVDLGNNLEINICKRCGIVYTSKKGE